MKGVVEIYGTNSNGEDELLIQKDNLTVVGFAENIVDLLTTPSATTYPTSKNSNILDASNYTVQAISTSKNAEHFRKNLHSYETSNLLNNTEFDETLDSSLSGWLTVNTTVSTNVVDGYKEGVSGTLVQADTSGGFITQLVYVNGIYGNTSGTYSDKEIFRYADSVFSVDLKWNEDNPPVKIASGTDYKSYSRIDYTSLGGTSVAEVYVAWDASGGATLVKSTEVGFEAGIRYLGSKWYRVFLKGFNGTADTGTRVVPYIYPCNAANVENSDIEVGLVVDSSAGSIYMARPQLELGRHPTKYVGVSSFVQTRDERVKFSLLSPSGPPYTRYDYYVASAGTGAYTLSGLYDKSITNPLGVSAYIPSSTSVTPPPHPEDRYLTTGARTPVEEALEVEIMQGQNPFVISASSILMLSSFGSPWTYASGYLPNIGRHAAYLNTYSGGSNAKIYLNIVSALDYSGYATPVSSSETYLGETEGGIGGNASLTDIFGYINLSDNGASAVYDAPSTGKSSFYRTVEPTFVSSGEIKYTLRLGQGETGTVGVDAPLLNLFGGVDTLGLWGMDVRAMRESDNLVNIPLNYNIDPAVSVETDVSQAALPKRRYKLYNKIVLTDNIVKNDGVGAGLPGIFNNYEAITVVWSLKFL